MLAHEGEGRERLPCRRRNNFSYGGWPDFAIRGPHLGVLEVTRWGTGAIPYDIILGHQETLKSEHF